VLLEVEDPSGRYRSPGSLLLVARGEGEPVGIAGLHLHGESAEVVRMYVRPQYRGRGVAVALLDRLRHEALRRGTRRLRLETDPVSMAAAARLYQRYGFRIVGAHMNEHVEFLDMELVLGPPNPD
jgi:GNAT superfamily N-acetyltransferase